MEGSFGLIFEALGEAQLEIHTGMMASSILSDTIPCHSLGLDAAAAASLSPSDAVPLASPLEVVAVA